MFNGVRMFAAAGVALFTSALAYPQAQTISAKPGMVNYIEGAAYLNGNKLSVEATRATFLVSGDSISTANGKVEVLLSPGVFLRLGDNSEVRMISPAILNTQIAVLSGEAMVEAAGLVKDNTVVVTDHGATITIEKNGLYRFFADTEPSAAVMDGKALVYFGEKKVELGKDREAILTADLKTRKFDPKQPDELYAWSNIRSEYDAAASYQSAQSLSASNSYGFGTGVGYPGYYPGYYGQGWFWNGAFDSWAWVPGYGAFYSPFGWGFYSPGLVGYAPVVTTGVYRGGAWLNGKPGTWQPGHHHWNGAVTATVPVNTKNPPAVGVMAVSPYALQQARVQAAHSLAETGSFSPRVSSGNGGSTRVIASSSTPVRGSGWSGGGNAARVSGGGGWAGGGGAAAHASGGGWSGGGGAAAHASGGFSGGGGGGGHAAGGGGGGGGGGGHK